jgi:type IV secretion system protein VirB4
MGGAHRALGLGADACETLAFQPLRRIDDATERSWAAEWIAALLGHEKVPRHARGEGRRLVGTR